MSMSGLLYLRPPYLVGQADLHKSNTDKNLTQVEQGKSKINQNFKIPILGHSFAASETGKQIN